MEDQPRRGRARKPTAKGAAYKRGVKRRAVGSAIDEPSAPPAPAYPSTHLCFVTYDQENCFQNFTTGLGTPQATEVEVDEGENASDDRDFFPQFNDLCLLRTTVDRTGMTIYLYKTPLFSYHVSMDAVQESLFTITFEVRSPPSAMVDASANHGSIIVEAPEGRRFVCTRDSGDKIYRQQTWDQNGHELDNHDLPSVFWISFRLRFESNTVASASGPLDFV